MNKVYHGIVYVGGEELYFPRGEGDGDSDQVFSTFVLVF